MFNSKISVPNVEEGAVSQATGLTGINISFLHIWSTWGKTLVPKTSFLDGQKQKPKLVLIQYFWTQCGSTLKTVWTGRTTSSSSSSSSSSAKTHRLDLFYWVTLWSAYLAANGFSFWNETSLQLLRHNQKASSNNIRKQVFFFFSKIKRLSWFWFLSFQNENPLAAKYTDPINHNIQRTGAAVHVKYFKKHENNKVLRGHK